MPSLFPFRGIRYDLCAVGGLREVIGPPEDIPTVEQVAELTTGRPYHCLLLERAHSALSDGNGGPAERFDRWLDAGVLRQAERPELYVYEHVFPVDEVRHRRLGFFALVDLRERGATGVLPHERILNQNLQLRLSLIRQVRANTSAVFTLMRDEGRLTAMLEELVEGLNPSACGDDDEGGSHRLWVIRDPRAWSPVVEMARRRALYIADGHHRYAAADAYRGELVRAGIEPGPANFVMAFVTSSEDPGVGILPIHRELKRIPVAGDAMLDRLGAYFEIESQLAGPSLDVDSLVDQVGQIAESDDSLPVFLLLDGTARRLHRLRLRDWQAVTAIPPRAISVTRRLDVAVLHQVALEAALKISPDESESLIDFSPDSAAIARRVLSGDSAAALFVRPTRIDQVLAAADAGERMPQKSTYFFPKVPAGLALYSLRR